MCTMTNTKEAGGNTVNVLIFKMFCMTCHQGVTNKTLNSSLLKSLNNCCFELLFWHLRTTLFGKDHCDMKIVL